MNPAASSISPDSGAVSRTLYGIADTMLSAVGWNGIRCVVDVGGGRGALLSTLLQSRSELAGILFDQPDVVPGAHEGLREFVTAGRCRIVAGNFFQSIPPGGDAYILKDVLRNWNDSRCLDILHNCRSAMSAKGRLLVIERMVEIAETSPTGIRSRTRDQFIELLQHVGLQVSTVAATPSGLDVLEAISA
jgi:hypothetical protein